MIAEREALVINHMHFAKSLARKFHNAYFTEHHSSVIDFDEMYSQALLQLVLAATTYDKKKNDCFSAYARVVISYKLGEMSNRYNSGYDLQKEHRHWKKIRGSSIETNLRYESKEADDLRLDDDSWLSDEGRSVEDVNYLKDFGGFLSTLNEKEFFFVKCRIYDDKTQKEIAEMMKDKFGMESCSQANVSQIKNSVKRKMKQYFEESDEEEKK